MLLITRSGAYAKTFLFLFFYLEQMTVPNGLIAFCLFDVGEMVEAMCLLVKRDKFEFNLNLSHKRNKYMYCELIFP
jgi:hypothetical protein